MIFKMLYPYLPLLLTIFVLAVIGLGFSVLMYVMSKKKEEKEKKKETLAEAVRNGAVNAYDDYERSVQFRQFIGPDAVDPNPGSYFTINDSGRDVFIRCFTLADKPKNMKFATTLATLFNFPDCKSSYLIEPMTNKSATHLLEKQIDILTGEQDAAEKNRNKNRLRNLYRDEREADKWANEIEDESNAFYKVSFLFALHADSLEKLDLASDNFNAKALEKNLTISCVYGMQAEAYLAMCPYNGVHGWLSKSTFLPRLLFDKKSLITLFNHTDEDFMHENGVPIARNLNTGHVALFDDHDKSHDGYSIVVAGITGSGKSLLIKQLIKYNVELGTHFAAVDSQSLGGHGEYYYVALSVNGVSYEISKKSNNVLNPWDIDAEVVLEEIGGEIREVRKLNLTEKIGEVKNVLMLQIQGEKTEAEFKLASFLERICLDISQELYDEEGIVDGEADSIYNSSQSALSAGMVRKKMPDYHKAYIKALQKNARETRPNYLDAYEIWLSAIKDYVRELYVSADGEKEYTKEEYERLPVDDRGTRFDEVKGKKVEVLRIIGSKPYYDGQSTISVSRECPFTNFDLSQLPDKEKVIARQICLMYITEHFVRKNSEDKYRAARLSVIFDEAQEQFENPRALAMADANVATARKKNVGFYFITQILQSFDKNEHTRAIYKNSCAKFIFKQDVGDREFLKKFLSISDSQAARIVSQGGETKGKGYAVKRRGECCLVDNHHCVFLKVLYDPSVDWYICESEAEQRVRYRKKYGSDFEQ